MKGYDEIHVKDVMTKFTTMNAAADYATGRAGFNDPALVISRGWDQFAVILTRHWQQFRDAGFEPVGWRAVAEFSVEE